MPRITSKLSRLAGITAAACCALAIAAAAAQAAPIGAYTTKGAWSFVSAPNLHPPKLTIDVKSQINKLAPGYFMVANFKELAIKAPMTGQSGPMILDHNLQPVWFFHDRRERAGGQPDGADATRASRCSAGGRAR